MDKLYEEIKKSFPKIKKLFDDTNLNNFICCGYENLSNYHFGLGTWIRNNLLSESCDLYILFVRGGILQKDDMAALIIHLFFISSFNKLHS